MCVYQKLLVGKPVLIYDSKCKGSKAYLGLAKEFLKQEKKKAVNE